MSSKLQIALVVLVLCPGCVRAGFWGATPDEQGDAARGDTAPPDGSRPPEMLVDGAGDIPGADGPIPNCLAPVDKDTIGRWSFDSIKGKIFADLTGKHPATLFGSGSLVPGNPKCGKGLSIPAMMEYGAFVLIPDSPAWDLKQGAIDFWVRLDEPISTLSTQGLVTRDAEHQVLGGHISIIRGCDGAIGVRLQASSDGTYAQCSEPVPDKVWMHVAVNFGPTTGLQLFIDGKLQNRTTKMVFSAYATTGCESSFPCGADTTLGIDGNDNPWVIGAASYSSKEGGTDGAAYHFGGVIDELRISSAPRSFGK